MWAARCITEIAVFLKGINSHSYFERGPGTGAAGEGGGGGAALHSGIPYAVYTVERHQSIPAAQRRFLGNDKASFKLYSLVSLAKVSETPFQALPTLQSIRFVSCAG